MQDQGKHEEAIGHYDETIHLNPQHAPSYNNRGNAKYVLGRHEAAIADYNEAVRLNPQHDKAYCNRGITKGVLGRHNEAIADFNETIRINPQYADAYYNRGNANKENRDYEKARGDLQRAFELATEQGNQKLAQVARSLLDQLPPASRKD